ncbi:hypothetical protein M758_UG261800 [Ceratodon purpureus]|nr:hypothetical protein M758_UG261800 [Ceratodon purpureus]
MGSDNFTLAVWRHRPRDKTVQASSKGYDRTDKPSTPIEEHSSSALLLTVPTSPRRHLHIQKKTISRCRLLRDITKDNKKGGKQTYPPLLLGTAMTSLKYEQSLLLIHGNQEHFKAHNQHTETLPCRPCERECPPSTAREPLSRPTKHRLSAQNEEENNK